MTEGLRDLSNVSKGGPFKSLMPALCAGGGDKRKKTSVVYFNQQMGASHAVGMQFASQNIIWPFKPIFVGNVKVAYPFSLLKMF